MNNFSNKLLFFAFFTLFTLALTTDISAAAPEVALNAPDDTLWTPNLTINFNYTPADDVLLENCSVYTNETGSWILEESNSSILINGSQNRITHTFPAIGGFLWNVGCFDSTQQSFAGSNRTVNLQGNDSLMAVRANTTDFIITSNSYIVGIAQQFNTTAANTNLSAWMETNLIKTSGGGANEIFVRVNVSQTTILEESLRSVSSVGDEGSAKMSPIIFNVSAGEHNITFEFRRTGGGNVEVDDIDFVLLAFETSSGTDIRVQNLSGFTTFSNNAPFESIVNWTITPAVASEVFMFVKLTVNSSESNLPVFRLADVDEGEFSATATRNVTSSNDIGSIGIPDSEMEEQGQHNHSIQGFLNVGSTSINYTIIDFDLREADNRTIQPFNAGHPGTNFTNNVTLTTGVHNIANTTVIMSNGTGFFVIGTASIHALSNAQTARLFFNITGQDETTCFAQKHRSFVAEEIGNVGFLTICNGNLVVGTTYVLNLWLEVSSGRSVRLHDESLNGFEIQPLNLSQTNVPPIANDINTPLNNTSFGGNITVNWTAFSDPNGDIVTYNVSLFNTDNTFNASINDSLIETDLLFVTSDFPEGTYLLVVEGCDPSDLCASNNITITLSQINVQIAFIFECMNNGNLTACPGLKTIGDNTDPAPMMALLAFLALSCLFMFLAVKLVEFGPFGQLFFGLLSFAFAILGLLVAPLYSSNVTTNEFMLNIYAIMQILVQGAGLLMVVLLTKFLLDTLADLTLKLGKK